MAAFVCVPEWTPEQVADWVVGLDDHVRHYKKSFLNNDIDGQRLLMLAPDDLLNLNIMKMGHQELILESVEQLKHAHFHVNDENLQWLALRLSCKARSLYNDLVHQMRNAAVDAPNRDRVATSTLSSVGDLLTSAKVLVSWLSRPPFSNQASCHTMREDILKLCIKLATNSQRDKFAEKPNEAIRDSCYTLFEMCDELIKESKDPLILQPGAIDVAVIKKKANEELGIQVQSSYAGIHIISGVKYQSPASACGRIDAGDEIVQVNYQTVIGWQLKKIVQAMKEDPVEVVLTLKKRPKHSATFARNFPNHLFIPTKKSTPKLPHKKIGPKNSNKPPPLVPPEQPTLAPPNPSTTLTETSTEDDDDDSTFLPEANDSQFSSSADVHLNIPKLHVALQRRATITGASPTNDRPPVRMDELWQEAKRGQIIRSLSHDVTKTGLTVKWYLESSLQRELATMEESDLLREHKNDHLSKMPHSPHRPITCIGGGDVSMEMRVKGQEDLLQEHPQHLRNERTVCSKNQEAHNIRNPKECGSVDDESATTVMPVNSCAPTAVTLEASSKRPGKSSLQRTVANTMPEKLPKKNPFDILSTTSQDAIVRNGTQSSKAKDDMCSEMQSPCQPTSLDGQEEQEKTFTSFQVIIVGGVPQKNPSFSKESKPSPSSSPKLRRRVKLRELTNRRISCKDLGQGDCQGWLYKGRVTKGLLHLYKWTKKWCVLKKSGFYVYEDDNATKAECFICLNGFNCSPALECKSKKYAFKVHHSGTTFYFASDSQADMAKWMNKIGLSAIAYDTQTFLTTSGPLLPAKQNLATENVYYSETDEESDATSESGSGLQKPSNLKQSASSSSLSSSSSYHSPLESWPPSSPSVDDNSPESLRNQHNVHGGSSDSFGEVKQDEDQPAAAKTSELQVNVSQAYAVASRPLSPNYSSIHLQTLKSDLRAEDTGHRESYHLRFAGQGRGCWEAINPFYAEAVDPCTAYNLRGGTLPALSSSKKEQPTRLFRGTSLEWKVSQDGKDMQPITPPLGSLVVCGSEPAKMSLAFEMNLDSSPPQDIASAYSSGQINLDASQKRRSSTSSQTSIESTRSLPITALKLFGSPKFVKKFTSHRAKSEAKLANKPQTSKWYDEPSSQAPASLPSMVPSKTSTKKSESTERQFLGSPKLARALYRAIHHKKSSSSSDKGNTVVARRLSGDSTSSTPAEYTLLQQIRISSIPSHLDDDSSTKSDESSSSAPTSPLARGQSNRTASNVDIRVHPETTEATPDTPRVSLKPAMGVSMIGKQRRTSSQLSESKSSRPHHYHPYAAATAINTTTTTASQATQTDSDHSGAGKGEQADDDLTRLAESLHAVDLHFDGTRLSQRRQNSIFRPHRDERCSFRILKKRALQRTLTAKERDLAAIEALLNSKITSEALKNWKQEYSYILERC